MLENDRFIRALLRQPVDRTPIWIMRQAGRYLPEYRKIRQSVSNFLELCQNPELACEVTLQPLRRYEFDAAILFSDILTIPHAMGLGLRFVEGEGPIFDHPLRDSNDIKQLKIPNMETDLAYVIDTTFAIKKALKNSLPLIGFAGSPWTLAAYMIEGGSSKTFNKIKAMVYSTPDLLHKVLSILAESVTIYLNAQIEAGANVIMIFDTWGGLLSESAYQEFSLNYMEKILAGLSKHNHQGVVPSILFTKGGGMWVEHIAATGCDAIGLDWTVNLKEAKRKAANRCALQGNLDPAVLYGTTDNIQKECQRILDEYGNDPGHIFNLGHGIYPDIDPTKVKFLVDTVQKYSAKNLNCELTAV